MKLLKKVYESWIFEISIILVLGLFFIAFFILGMNRDDVTDLASQALAASVHALLNGMNFVQSLLTTNISSFITAIFAFSAIAFLLYRMRWRIQQSNRFTNTYCPHCSFPLSRIKRKNWQRKLSQLLPLRRFYCKKCSWKGARVKSSDNIPLYSDQPHSHNRSHPQNIQQSG